MTERQVIRILKERQGDRTAKVLAKELGISPQYLCDIYKGKRVPGERVLSKLGLRWELVRK